MVLDRLLPWLKTKNLFPDWMGGDNLPPPILGNIKRKTFPRWLRPHNLVPHWMHLYEIEVEVIGGGPSYEVFEYSSSAVISLYIHSISVSQCNDILETTKNLIKSYHSDYVFKLCRF